MSNIVIGLVLMAYVIESITYMIRHPYVGGAGELAGPFEQKIERV